MRLHYAELAQTFPVDPRYASAVAQFYSVTRWPGSAPAAIIALQDAIAIDPFAADLHRNLAGLFVETGQIEAAQWEIALTHAISPKSKIVLRVKVAP